MAPALALGLPACGEPSTIELSPGPGLGAYEGSGDSATTGDDDESGANPTHAGTSTPPAETDTGDDADTGTPSDPPGPAQPLPQGGFGTDTRGGLDGEIFVVTTLDDSGPGSLREAVEADGPRLVVFEVGGAIELLRDLQITRADLTIAGQTAPSPGISLYHGRVAIKTHDVVVQHLRLRPGDRSADGPLISADVADNRDALLIGTSSADTHHIVIDNVSMSWSLDEMVSVWYGRTSDITIRDSIMGEPLSVSLHPKSTNGVSHGYCLLFGDDTVRASVIGNVFAHCTRRSPRVGPGSEVVVLDNVIYNPVETGINIQGSYANDTTMTVIGNVFKPGDDTKDTTALLLSKHTGPASLRVFFEDNTMMEGHPLTGGSASPVDLDQPEVWDESHEARDPAQVLDLATEHAGARPRDRDPVDERIIAQVRDGTGARIDYTDDVGGYPELESTQHTLEIPADPHGDDDDDGYTNVEEWLAGYTAQVEPVQ
ncbi:MAG: hypothetical protein AAGF11_38145 [Myxococcota bacterium]